MTDTIETGVLIIGKGPAGLQAAIHLARAGVDAVVAGHGAGSLAAAERIENYYGLREPVSGGELARIGEAQVRALGVDILETQIIGLAYADGGGYAARTPEREIRAGAVLIATGSKRIKAPVGGVDRLEGKGVSYCAVCDGFLYRGKQTGVLGFSEYALGETLELSAVVGSTVIFTNGEPARFGDSAAARERAARFEVVSRPIERLEGRERLEGVRFKDGGFRALDGIFIAYGMAGGQDLAKKLGVLLGPAGDIVTDGGQRTNVPGVFAAGDCTGVFRQIAVAVGQGALAARSAVAYLREK